VCPGLGSLLGHPDRMLGVVGARTRQYLGPVTDGIDHRPDQIRLLRGVRGRRLTGRAVEDDAVMTVLDQVHSECGRGVEIDGPIVRHRRDHGREQGTERAGSGLGHADQTTGCHSPPSSALRRRRSAGGPRRAGS
jgi:hypothetical protein